MEPLQKLAWANHEARFESDGDPQLSKKSRHGYTAKQIRERYGHLGPEPCISAKGADIPIYMASGGSGRRVPLLKSMLTTACERNCNYCAFRAQRDYRRITFKSEELAQTFNDAYTAGWVDGLFLSTGVIAGGLRTQDTLLKTADILRRKHKYRGYLHLKIMPGADREQVRMAMRLANRVSANLEAPNQTFLSQLAPQKRFKQELLEPLLWAEEIRREERFQPTAWATNWASTATQFVVGPAGESDLDLLSTVATLFTRSSLRRAYFEAFNPIQGTPFENLIAESTQRQHRLYQASYLLRDYAFDLEELPFQSDGNLPMERDPKQAYADLHFRETPLELNQAPRHHLMRIPGIGRRTADAILRTRSHHPLRELGQLRGLGVVAERSAPYILIDGKRPPQQSSFFANPAQ